MAESNSFYESPNLDLSGPGGSNQQSQLDQENAEFNALLEQFSADGVITDEERAILSGVSNGQGAAVGPTSNEPGFLYNTFVNAPVKADQIATEFMSNLGNKISTVYDDLLGSAMRNLTPAEDRRFANNEPFGKTFTDTFAITRPDGTKFYPDEVTSQTATQPSTATETQFTSPDSLALPSETVGQVPSVNAFSSENAGQVNAMMEAQSLEATQGGATAPPTAQTLSQFMRYEDSPEQRTEQFVDEQGRLRLRPTPEAAQLQGLSDFVQPSLDEREMRLAERDRLPGETQTGRDTRIAQSRTTGARTEGMSFDDAKRRAEGELVQRGVRNPSSSQVNALAGLIRAQEPERLESLRIKRAKDLAKLNFEPKVVEVEGQKLIQLAPEYYQPVRAEPKGDEPFEPRILDHNNFIYFEIAPNRFERQPSDGQTRDDIIDLIKQRQAEEAMSTTPAEGSNSSDVKSYATEAEARASGVKGEVLIGGRRAIIE